MVVRTELDSVFEALASSAQERVTMEADERHRIIQKYIILDHIDRKSELNINDVIIAIRYQTIIKVKSSLLT